MQDTRMKKEPEERPEKNIERPERPEKNVPKIALMAIVVTVLLVLIIASGRSCGTDTKRASTDVEVSQTSITTENGGVSEESTWGAENTQQTLEQTSSTTKLTTTTKATATTTTTKAAVKPKTTTKASAKAVVTRKRTAAPVTQKKTTAAKQPVTQKATTTPLIRVANVVGDTYTSAAQELVGLSIMIKREKSTSVKKDYVIRQGIEAGTRVPKGTAITLVVSDGVPKVSVANVVGKSKSNASSTLKGQGFSVTVKEDYSSFSAGAVYSQSPAGGSNLNYGSSVTIYVSKGLRPVTLYFDANGGSLGTSSKTVYSTSNYGTLPTPTRSYYTFLGWYTSYSGGSKVTSSSTVTSTASHTLYAHWKQNEVSGWVLSSSVPSDAQIVDQKWTYDKTERTTSSATSMSGWKRVGGTWNKTGSGTHYYASFPSGYNTNDRFYTSLGKSALGGYDNGSSKREVSGAAWNSYIYYHWTYPLSSYNEKTFDRKVSNVYNTWLSGGGYATLWYSFESTTDYPRPNGGAYKAQISAYQASSYWWYRVSVYRQTYTDYSATYTYERTTTGLTSYSSVSAGNGISNVQKWVTYRKK